MRDINEYADEQRITSKQLMGYALKSNYLEDKSAATIGKKLFQEETTGDLGKLTVELAVSIYVSCSFTKRKYIHMRNILASVDMNIFPLYDDIAGYLDQITPDIKKVESDCPLVGVKIDYDDALRMTTTRILSTLTMTQPLVINEINLMIHDGIDGSGSHSIFNQKNNEKTSNILMYMFRAEKITDESGTVIWSNPKSGSASACRPLMLLLGKENHENLEIVEKVQKERNNLTFEVTYNNHPIQVNVQGCMSMIDGKMRTILSGKGRVKTYAGGGGFPIFLAHKS